MALREGRPAELQRLVKASPKSVNARGQDGWTPLMYAALYGDVESSRLLLDRGAEVNARNDAGGTALMYAVDDLPKTKLLLERGADPNLRSGEGRTALLIAVASSASFPVVKLLLDKGADAKLRLPDGRGALALAQTSLDPPMVQLLLDRGATRPLPLATAVTMGCAECVEMMLPHAEAPDLSAALRAATAWGDLRAIDLLLKRGAQAPPAILQFAALSPTPIPAATIQTFLSRGADPHSKTSFGLTNLDLARRQGNQELVKVLLEAGVREESPAPAAPQPKPAGSIRSAVDRAIPPLQRCDAAFLDRAGCVSCHNNSLTAMTVSDARSRGFRVNEQIASSQLKKISAFLQDNSERALENEGIPGGIDTVSYILLGLGGREVSQRCHHRCLGAVCQEQSIRRWPVQMPGRAPAARDERRAGHGRDHTVATRVCAEEQAHRVPECRGPGGSLAGEGGAGKHGRSRFPGVGIDLGRREPRGDPQDGFTASGAAAIRWRLGADTPTGVRCLCDRPGAGRVTASGDPAYGQRAVPARRAIPRPIATGRRSWLVRTRSPSFQPYFDSDFPHGYDQFISAAATNWAVMALMPAASKGANASPRNDAPVRPVAGPT